MASGAVLTNTEPGPAVTVPPKAPTREQAIAAFAGLDLGLAVVEPQARAVLLDYERTVQHYEVCRIVWPAA